MDTMKIPWERFWRPDKEGVNLEGPYLSDPAGDFGKMYNPSVKVINELKEVPCLILLGEPGSGKSFEINALQKSRVEAENKLVIFRNLKSYSSDALLDRDLFGARMFTEWLASDLNLEIILDSLDECMLHIPTVVERLGDRFAQCPPDRLKLRIVCREADWPIAFGERLKSIWGVDNFEIVHLTPLRRKDVDLAASNWANIDQERFIHMLHYSEMEAFATRPVTLFMLLNQFSETGDFGANRADLYRSYCRFLCEETLRSTFSRKLLPDVNQKIAIAERLAAVSIFSKSPAIYFGSAITSQPSGDIVLSEVVGGLEKTEQGDSVSIDNNSVIATLESGLFEQRGLERREWSHWTYAEFLAACYLNKKDMTVDQLLLLLSSNEPLDDGPILPPQVREVAAWLAGMNSEVRERLVETDPVSLIRSQAATDDEEFREKLVSALLYQVESAQIPDVSFLRQNLEILSHSKLDEQLRPFVVGESGGLFVRRVAIDIAEACHAENLLDDLLNLALDPDGDYRLRIEAAHAVSKIGKDIHKLGLKPLLNSEENDPDDELKGITLGALWPGLMEEEEVFLHLTEPKNANLIGMYSYFLRYVVPKNLSIDAIPIALKWVLDVPKREPTTISPREELANHILNSSWKNLETPGVLQPFAEIAFLRVKNHVPILGERTSSRRHSSLPDEPAKRRLLASTIGEIVTLPNDKQAWDLLCFETFHSPEDYEWAVSRLENSETPKEQELWGILVFRLFDRENTSHLVQIAELMEKYSILKDNFLYLFKAIDLGSEEADRQKKYWKMANEREANQSQPVDYENLTKSRIAEWRKGDLKAWWQLCLQLRLQPLTSGRYDYYDIFDPDLTSTPGWKCLNVTLQEELFDMAHNYLSRAIPQPEEWFGKNVIHYPSTAAYSALWLLYKEKNEVFDSLASDIWEKWSSIIVGFPNYPSNEPEDPVFLLTKMSFRNAPESTTGWLVKLLEKESSEGTFLSAHERFRDVWDENLTNTLLELMQKLSLSPESFTSILVWLCKFDFARDSVITFAKQTLPQREKINDLGRKNAGRAGALILLYGGEANWPELKEILYQEKDFGREVLLHASDHREYPHKELSGFSILGLKELYLFVYELFPPSEDPKHQGAHWLGPRDQVANFRSALLQIIKSQGTNESINVLHEIAEILGEDWMHYMAAESRNIFLAKRWRSIPPKELIEFTSKSEKRLVRSNSELCLIVIESLNRFQSRISGEGGLAHELWNTDSMTPKDEELISDSITDYLRRDLKQSGIVCNRNVDISRCSEVDIVIEATDERKKESYKAIVEVKGNWHREVDSAMKTQLRDQYLDIASTDQGIYLVVWFPRHQIGKDSKKKNRSGAKSFKDACELFRTQSEELSTEQLHISSFVLDASMHLPNRAQPHTK